MYDEERRKHLILDRALYFGASTLVTGRTSSDDLDGKQVTLLTMEVFDIEADKRTWPPR